MGIKKVNIIVATAPNGGFGHQGKKPWPSIGLIIETLSNRAVNGTFIMGTKTAESMTNLEKDTITKEGKIIIVGRTISLDKFPTDSLQAKNLNHALSVVRTAEAHLIGGFGIFKEGLQHNLVNTIYRINVLDPFACDVFFPQLGGEWEIKSKGEPITDTTSKIPISFDVLINSKNPM